LYFNDSEVETVRTNLNLFNEICKDYELKDVKGYSVSRNGLNHWLSLTKLKTEIVFEQEATQNDHTYIYNECPIFYLLNKDHQIVERANSLDEIKKVLKGIDLK
jgi:hypothetical protein